MRRGAVTVALVVGLATSVLGGSAHATEPCEENEACHNNWAEPIIMFATSTEAFGMGFVGMIGNAASLATREKTAPAWLAVGYTGASYNLVLGLTWTSIAGQSLVDFPDDGYAKMQLGVGLAHLALSATTFGLTIAGQARRARAADEAEAGFIAMPSVVPTRGGAIVQVGGQF